MSSALTDQSAPLAGAASPSLPVRASHDEEEAAPTAPPPFAELYAARFESVCRWARALGGAEADLDDLAQEVFVVVRRKLPAFVGADPSAWLYRITARTVSDYRRRAWFRNLFSRRAEIDIDDLGGHGPDAAEALESRRARALFWRLVAELNETRRSTLVLFEIEGLSGEEIATLQDVPVATVWTRLHRARTQLATLVRREQERMP